MTMEYPNLFPAERVWGNLNLGPGHFMYAPGGFVGLSNSRGKLWFVDGPNGNDSWDGTLPKRFGSTTMGPKATITAALAVASDYDAILINLGVYDEGAVLTITQKGLKLLGVMTSGLMWGQPSIKGLAANTELINVKNDSVEIAGIGFTQNNAKTIIAIAEDAWGLNTWRTHIHHCFFGGNVVATFGVWGGGVGTDAPSSIVEDSEFYDCLTSIRQNGSLWTSRRNQISVPAGGVGIEDVPNTSSRPTRWILKNKIITKDVVNAIGIKVDNTPDPGQLMIDGNHLVNFANAAHACNVSGSGKTGLMGLNYLGLTAIPIS